jgi:hypothetical protein
LGEGKLSVVPGAIQGINPAAWLDSILNRHIDA